MHNKLLNGFVNKAIGDEDCYFLSYVPKNFFEKFAKLIVHECTELTLDYKSEPYYNGWLDYRDEIKKHFGVEE